MIRAVHREPVGAALEHQTSRDLAADRVQLALVREDEVRIEQLEAIQQLLGPVLDDSGGRSKVDADPAALRLHRAGSLRSRLLDRAAQERVPREMQP